MEIKVNPMLSGQLAESGKMTKQEGEDFRFALMKQIDDSSLVERLEAVYRSIATEGKRLKKHLDIRDMRRYRSLIKEFLNEVLTRSHRFSRENFLDRRGRHRVYGIIRVINKELDELAEELVKDEKDVIAVLGKVDEIQGLLLDLFM